MMFLILPTVAKRESGNFVTPGSRLGIIEEFIAGPGTYVKGGTIYSKVTGHVLFNVPEKRVSVYPAMRLSRIPKRGRVVIGKVESVIDREAFVEILQVGRSRVTSSLQGFLHMSLVGQRGVRRMGDLFKRGDIIQAIVVNDRNGIYLGTGGARFGVVSGLSTCCGKVLELRRGQLVCPKCGRLNKRKVSSDYGRVGF